jgi:hypothetical protein
MRPLKSFIPTPSVKRRHGSAAGWNFQRRVRLVAARKISFGPGTIWVPVNLLLEAQRKLHEKSVNSL